MKKNTDRAASKQRQLSGLVMWKKGQSGNPKGRPKGLLSIKDLVRQHLEDNDEELEEFVRHFVRKNRELTWQMLEGRPSQDLTSQGEKLEQVPIYAGKSTDSIHGHNSDAKDIQAD